MNIKNKGNLQTTMIKLRETKENENDDYNKLQ